MLQPKSQQHPRRVTQSLTPTAAKEWRKCLRLGAALRLFPPRARHFATSFFGGCWCVFAPCSLFRHMLTQWRKNCARGEKRLFVLRRGCCCVILPPLTIRGVKITKCLAPRRLAGCWAGAKRYARGAKKCARGAALRLFPPRAPLFSPCSPFRPFAPAPVLSLSPRSLCSGARGCARGVGGRIEISSYNGRCTLFVNTACARGLFGVSSVFVSRR